MSNTGLLVYGSLMHPESLAGAFGDAVAAVPVRVRGFRRSFCQEPSWRRGSGASRGVLTVRPSADSWFSGILVRDVDGQVFPGLDHRERGYHRVPVALSAVEPYEAGPDLEHTDRIQIYRGRPEKWRPGLRPNRRYLRLCRDAAARWGKRFLDDFLATTLVGSVPLRDLEQRASADVE